MKCPKCGYLGIDSGDRCKNCGYEFSLIEAQAPAPGPGSVRLRATPLNTPPRPRLDSARLRAGRSSRETPAALDGALNRPLERIPDSAPVDLPLFDAGFPAGTALPPPHRPLSVRRPGAPTPRPRPKPEPVPHQELPLEPDEPIASAPPEPDTGSRARVTHETRGASATTASVPGQPASALRRLASAAVDLCVMVLVDLVTVYFTLRLAGLEPSEWSILPVLPAIVFFLLLNGGYVVILTGTLGQTLGKMALQIGVVADGRPTVGLVRAALRTAVALISILPAGLGLLWGLVGDRRALHDRLCGTRVIRFTVA